MKKNKKIFVLILAILGLVFVFESIRLWIEYFDMEEDGLGGFSAKYTAIITTCISAVILVVFTIAISRNRTNE